MKTTIVLFCAAVHGCSLVDGRALPPLPRDSERPEDGHVGAAFGSGQQTDCVAPGITQSGVRRVLARWKVGFFEGIGSERGIAWRVGRWRHQRVVALGGLLQYVTGILDPSPTRLLLEWSQGDHAALD